MLTRAAFCFIFALGIQIITCDSIKEDEGVLVLTETNFDTAIAENEYILVEFYAPWCGHCKALAPHYAEAAGKLKEKHPEIKLAKIDATEENALSEKYNVRGYPTLKFFRRGFPIEFTGGRKADEIISWLLQYSGPAAVPIASTDELKAFREKHQVSVVGFFPEETDAYKVFMGVANTFVEVPFGLVKDTSIGNADEIILNNQHDESEAVYDGENKEADLRNFIAARSLPLFIEFNHDTARKIFDGEFKSHVLFFLSKKAGDIEKLESVKPVAKEFRQKIIFVIINIDEPDHERIIEYFGIPQDEIPGMRIIRLEEELIKFKPESSEISGDNVRKFVQDYLDGKVKEHLLSQALPEDWNKGPVSVLVASNFDEVAMDKGKDVLVEFYAPWCGHCKQLAPIYDKLGEAFKSKDDVVIAKMDATLNELEHTKITSFPTIKLYKKETNEVIDYKGERTLKGLTKFLETGGEYGQGPPDKEDVDEDEDVPAKDEL